MKTLISNLISILLLASYMNAQNPQNGWSFLYQGDSFSDDALLDLSYLNEAVAGENGFIRLSEDGSHFVNDQGEIRFWAINGGELLRNHDPNLNDRDLETYARFLSKMGVNMIRFHGELFSKSNNINAPDDREIEYIWRVVAAMKKEGIYTTISPFWPAHLENIPDSWNLGDYKGGIDPWGLIYFDGNFRNAYKSWVSKLYTQTNPYTGIPLKDDPAVGLIQIINEDGVFFWTIGGVQPSLNVMMEQQFFNWAVSTYGNINAALENWEQTSLSKDNPGQKRLEIIQIWFATDDPNVPPASNGFKKRLADQMRFFAEAQRATYQELYDHYRSIGCKQLINASNWRTASSSRLLDLERWSTLPGEVLALNRYFDPGHFGPNNGWRIERLDHYIGNSAMYFPHLLPINVKQVKGRPFLVTESGWNLPNKYQAEGPFLIAAYQSLCGIDGFYWFSPTSTTYEDFPYFPYFGPVKGENPMFRWTNSIPGQIGMFPANALAYRLGYIQQGAVVVSEKRTLEALYKGETPLVTEEKSFDPNRDSYDPNPASGETPLSPLTFLTGPVEVEYSAENGKTSFVAEDLENLANISEKVLTSNTNELVWDYQQGICWLNTPKAQGICGFPGNKTYELDNLSISSTNEYVVVNVVAMDNLPLAQSAKILIQVGTVYQPTGWKETATKFRPTNESGEVDGFLIESLGRMPWKAANTEVTITLKDIRIQSVWNLDPAGYRKEAVNTIVNGRETIFNLPAASMYLVLETVTTTGLNDPDRMSDPKIQIYPNPNEGTFSIEIPEIYEGISIGNLEILDAAGKRISYFEHRAGNKHYQIKGPAGAYFVKLYLKNNSTVVQKIIVQ